MIHIYTDGSHVSNNDIMPSGGFAVFIPQHNFKYYEKIREEKTNICRAELLAVKKALEYIRDNPGQYAIHCDNESIVRGFVGISSRKANLDIWHVIYGIIKEIKANRENYFRVVFLDASKLAPESMIKKYADTVDHLAFLAANKLCC